MCFVIFLVFDFSKKMIIKNATWPSVSGIEPMACGCLLGLMEKHFGVFSHHFVMQVLFCLIQALCLLHFWFELNLESMSKASGPSFPFLMVPSFPPFHITV